MHNDHNVMCNNCENTFCTPQLADYDPTVLNSTNTIDKITDKCPNCGDNKKGSTILNSVSAYMDKKGYIHGNITDENGITYFLSLRASTTYSKTGRLRIPSQTSFHREIYVTTSTSSWHHTLNSRNFRGETLKTDLAIKKCREAWLKKIEKSFGITDAEFSSI